MLFFSQVKPMVAPNHNHGVVGMGTLSESIQHGTYAVVYKSSGSEVGLDKAPPLSRFLHLSVCRCNLIHVLKVAGYIIHVPRRRLG